MERDPFNSAIKNTTSMTIITGKKKKRKRKIVTTK